MILTNNISWWAEQILKGGPGSGIRGHRTAREAQAFEKKAYKELHNELKGRSDWKIVSDGDAIKSDGTATGKWGSVKPHSVLSDPNFGTFRAVFYKNIWGPGKPTSKTFHKTAKEAIAKIDSFIKTKKEGKT